VRIVHLINSLDVGGAEQVVTSLAIHQSGAGHSVRVVCLRDLGPDPLNVDRLREAGVAIVTLEKPPGLHFGTLSKLVAYLKTERIEVLHTHNHLVHHYGALAGRAARVPAILNSLHGSASLLTSAAWTKVLFWLSCLLGDKVIGVCRQVESVLRRAFPLPSGKVGMVDNGVELSRFLQLPARVPGRVVVFGSIGRLDPVKDHANLLEAFALVWNRHPRVELRLLGSGDLRQKLEENAKTLGIAERVHFEGFSQDTAGFLARLDIYVISSSSEGLPLTLLEAMGAARPIVATAVGEIPDIVGSARCGWLCPPSSPTELAAAMEQALLAPELGAIGARGRNAARAHYSIERMARDYQEIYTAAIAGGTRGVAAPRA
jgi:glycosyltransferase involved in cell wall biosynthesis